jgi:hypothetical protein
MVTKESYRKKVEDKLKEMDDQIQKLRTQGSAVKAESKTEYDQDLQNLSNMRERAEQRIREMEVEQKENWEEVSQRADRILEELKQAIADAVERVRDKIEKKEKREI